MPAIALLVALAGLAGPAGAQLTKIKVGWCARTVSAAAAPFAIAAKLGWLRQEGIEVELVPMPGSTDCVKNVAIREVDFSLPSVEPLAVGRPQGIKAQIFSRRTRETSTGSPCRRTARSRSSRTSGASASA